MISLARVVASWGTGPKGQSTRSRRQPELGQHGLHGAGCLPQVVHGVGERRPQLSVDPSGLLVVTGLERPDHPGHVLATPVRRHADDANRTDGEQRQREVVAGVEAGVVRCFAHDPRRLGGVAAGVLQADDGRDLRGQPHDRLDRHAPGSAVRDVVHDDRHVRGCSDGTHVGFDARLRRPVVVGDDHQQAVDAGLLPPAATVRRCDACRCCRYRPAAARRPLGGPPARSPPSRRRSRSGPHLSCR